jgi:hypothetical protein
MATPLKVLRMVVESQKKTSILNCTIQSRHYNMAYQDSYKYKNTGKCVVNTEDIYPEIDKLRHVWPRWNAYHA